MKIRSTTQNNIVDVFAQETISWTPIEHDYNISLSLYLLRHGIPHLLSIGLHEEACTRLLDIDYANLFIHAHEEVVHAARIWRAVGSKVLEQGYHTQIEELIQVDIEDATLLDPWDTLVGFLEELGSYQLSLKLCEWTYQQAKRISDTSTGNLDHIRTQLATLLYRVDRYDEAEALYKESLAHTVARH